MTISTSFKRALFGALIVFLFLGALAIFFPYNFSLLGSCENTIHSQISSPDGKLKALVFDRNCGATTGFNTQVSILKVNSDLKDEAGNIYIINGHPDSTNVIISWLNNDTLYIDKKVSGSEFLVNSTWGSREKVSIQYK